MGSLETVLSLTILEASKMFLFVAQVNPIVGDIPGNAKKIIETIGRARESGVELVLFPELVLCGYPPEDFLLLPSFIDRIEEWTHKIVKETAGIAVIFGLPRRAPSKSEKPLYNSAIVVENRKILGYQDKALLPTYDVFDESRYFDSHCKHHLWTIAGKKIAITICEDLWGPSNLVKYTQYSHDPVEVIRTLNPDLVVNLSASPYSWGKFRDRLEVCTFPAKSLQCPVVLCNQVGGNDSLIFDGHSLFVDQEGRLRGLAKGFEEDDWIVDLSVLERKPERDIPFPDELFSLHKALVLGIKDYFFKSGFEKACFGLSGGVDSALVACLAVEALGSENILALSLPSRYSSEGSLTDAFELAKNLKIECKEIAIEGPFKAFLDLLEPHFEDRPFDATEENLQARIRGMILMAFSNKFGYIVLSTGNKSEMAMGFATLYGDMCGGLGILSDVTKDQVYRLCRLINERNNLIPESILTKPPSAELRPNQKDSDSLPEYAIIDTVLEAYVVNHMSEKEIVERYGYKIELVTDLIHRIHRNEYKRRQAAPGLRVSQKSFTVGRRFPIVQKWVY